MARPPASKPPAAVPIAAQPPALPTAGGSYKLVDGELRRMNPAADAPETGADATPETPTETGA